MKKIFKRFIDEYLKDVLIFSFLFASIYLVVIYIFSYYNKSFIWETDGLSQHYITLYYFKNLINNFINYGTFNTFTWSLGYGMDMFTNLSYYSFGDIFSWLSVCFKDISLENYIELTTFFRIYLTGISFILFCRYKKIKGHGVIVGALMYTFSSWTYILGFRHPYMMNALIVLPLMMIGIERCIKDNKNIFLVIITVITFLLGFYFAYIIGVITVIYGILLSIFCYKKDIKGIIISLARALFFGILSFMLSSFITVPSLYQFLISSREYGVSTYQYFSAYYHNVFTFFWNNYLSNNNTYLGLSSIFVIGFSLFIYNRKDYPSIIVTLFMLLALFIPYLGSFLVGFSYPLNRWTFILCFFLSYMTAYSLKNKIIINHKHIRIILFTLIIFVFGLFITDSDIRPIFMLDLFILLFSIYLYSNNFLTKKKWFFLRNTLVVFLVSFGLGYNIYSFFGPGEVANVNAFVVKGTIDSNIKTNNNKTLKYEEAINFIKLRDKSYYLIGKYPTSLQNSNVSLFMGYNSMDYYYSINSKNYSALSKDLDNSLYLVSYEISDFNNRTRITSLLGNKYFITNNKNFVPYGYRLIKSFEPGNTYIYQNNNYIPFAILYNDYIDIKDYEELNEYEKELVLLKTTAIDYKTNLTKFNNYKNKIKENYSVSKVKIDYSSTNKIKENRIKILNYKNEYLYVTPNDKINNSEVYIKISGIKKEGLPENDILNQEVTNKSDVLVDRYLNDSKWEYLGNEFTISVRAMKKTQSELTRDEISSPYYFENNNIFINLGYFEKFKGNIRISFNKNGIYTFDKIEVISVNFKDYKKDIDSLSKSNFKYLESSDGYMKFEVNPEYSGILQMNTNYLEGWKVYVDGKRVDTFVSNKYFLGIDITKGKHLIEMKYETPYLNEGRKLTRIGIDIFSFYIVIVILRKVYIKLKKREN